MGKNNKGKPKQITKSVESPVAVSSFSTVVSTPVPEVTMAKKEIPPDKDIRVLDHPDGKAESGTPSTPSKQQSSVGGDTDLRLIIERLRKEKDLLAAEKDKVLLEKVREIDRLHSELQSANFYLETKSSELTLISTHVKEIESHIEVSSKELQEHTKDVVLSSNSHQSTVITTSSTETDEHSRQVLSLISLLSTMKAKVKSQSDQGSVLEESQKENELLTSQLHSTTSELNIAQATIEDLHSGLKSLQTQYIQLEKDHKKTRHTLIELTETHTDTVQQHQKQMSQLTTEIEKLNQIIEQGEVDKEQLISEHKLSLESSLDDLELFRNELRDTIAELNASYTQLANVEAAHQVEIDKLKDEANIAEEKRNSTVEQLQQHTEEADKEQQYLQQQLEQANDSRAMSAQRISELSDCVEQLETEKGELVQELHRIMSSLKEARSELHSTQHSLSESQSQTTSASLSYQHEIERLSGELTVLEAVYAALKADNADLAHKSGRSDEIQAELISLQEVKAKLLSDNQLLQHDVQRSQEAQHNTEHAMEQLRRESDTLVVDKEVLSDELAQLTFSNNHLNGELQHSQSVVHRLTEELSQTTHALTVLQTQHTHLQHEFDLLQQHVAHMNDTHSMTVSQLTSQMSVVDANNSKKFLDLTESLKKANEALASHLNTEAQRIKNAERLVVVLEASLEDKTKELNAMTVKYTALEVTKVDLLQQLSEVTESCKTAKERIVALEADSVAKDELHSHLINTSQEVQELRRCNSQLTEVQSKYVAVALSHQKQTMETESLLNSDVHSLNRHIVELNSTILDLKSQIGDLQRGVINQSIDVSLFSEYAASAREAEANVAFNKESVRNHLLRNGVKAFHWEDLITLMKKIEVLHSHPQQSICYLADVLDISYGGNSAINSSSNNNNYNPLNSSFQSYDGSVGRKFNKLSVKSEDAEDSKIGTSLVLNTSLTSEDMNNNNGSKSTSTSVSGKRSGSAQKARSVTSTDNSTTSTATYTFANHPQKRPTTPVMVAGMRRPLSNSRGSTLTPTFFAVEHSDVTNSEIDGHQNQQLRSLSTPKGARRPSFNSETGSKNGQSVSSDNRRHWHIPGVHQDDPFGDVGPTFRDVRSVHAGIEERFELLKNQPAAHFDYKDIRHLPSSVVTGVGIAAIAHESPSKVLGELNTSLSSQNSQEN